MKARDNPNIDFNFLFLELGIASIVNFQVLAQQ